VTTAYERQEPTGEQTWRDRLWFCCSCFASEEGPGSGWGDRCQNGYCLNCGHGPQAQISRAAIEEIRRTAGWVGRRFYPDQEAIEMWAELSALRVLAPADPTDQAEEALDDQGASYAPRHWWVYRRKGTTRTGIGTIEAATAEEAIERARPKLPYVPENHA
jgi:hypothetical protein